MSDEHSKLDRVLGLLEDVRETSEGGWRARCPAHGGKTDDDLSIKVGRNWILLHCFANCPWSAILTTLDLKSEDLVLDDESPKARRRPVSQRERELTAMACALRLQNEPKILEQLRFGRGWAAKALELLHVGYDGSRLTLPVRDESGKLHDTLRYDPFTKTGRKVLAGKGRSRLPWPAPELVDTHVLFIVEGEGTVISMLSVGLHAVGLPGSIQPSLNVSRPGRWQGVGWHKAWARRFERFKQLVLLPDCDGSGRALMGAVSYDLRKLGHTAPIVDLAPKLHDGSDVADILLKGAYDGPGRRAAKEILRETVAEQAEVLVAA